MKRKPTREKVANYLFKKARHYGKKVCDSTGEHEWLYFEDQPEWTKNDPLWICLRCGFKSYEKNPPGIKRYN